MLIEFRTQNYKSFVEEIVFSMKKAPKLTGIDYSLMKEKVKSTTITGLSSSVIYGPNASGKTNIIGAMDVLRAIILRGNIRNFDDNSSPNPASVTLELIPNSNLEIPKPVMFSIEFTENNMLFKYELVIDLGLFLDEAYNRKIIHEELHVNNKMVFKRNDDIQIGNLNVIKEFLPKGVKLNMKSINDIALNSLNMEELFLVNGFKLIYSQAIVKVILDWFTEKFMVIYRADAMQLVNKYSDSGRKTVYVERTTDKAAKLFGINSNAIGYVFSEEDSEAKLYSIFKKLSNNKSVAIAADLFESYGTIRFVNIFPLVIRAIQTGGTLIVDEFDASIHPMALMSIINVFHNDDINIHHAQLVFNTHNPIFLNSNLFRRDEIKFVEREEGSHISSLYALSDFGTSGENGVRKHEDYMKNYFISQYGAIKDIDFTPIFEEIIKNKSEV